ncbi:MAG: VanZ family protein [Thermodesulfobacteriota bacterium]
MNPKWTLRLGTVVLVAMMYTAALWPFEFIPVCVNPKVQWLPDESAVQIAPCRTLSTPTPPASLGRHFQSSSGISVEVDLKTATADQSGPARIVTYSFNTRYRNFTLGQQKDALVFRLRTTDTDPNGTDPVLEVPSVFEPGTRRHLVVTYDGKVQHLYLDGRRIHTSRKLQGDFSNWNSRHFFVLGDELTGNRPWQGILYSVSLYDHALSETMVQERFNAVRLTSFDFGPSDPKMITVADPHLQEPGLVGRFIFAQNTGSRVPDQSPSRLVGDLTTARFQSPLKEIFLNDFTVVFSRKDMVVNILGFIPLGILIALNFSAPRRPAWLKIYLVPILIGFGVSFSFEFLQQFTYSRNPNVLDILYNVGGAALGSIAIHVREKIGKR